MIRPKAEEIQEAYCDGDIWNYRIGFSVQHTPPEPPAPWFTVVWAIDETIDKVKRKYPNAKVFICLTDENSNFREGFAITKPYKGGRNAPKPYYWRKIRDYLYSLPNVLVSENEEADDLMSKALIQRKNVVVVTEDKDLKNTPGLHFNDKTGAETWVTPAIAYRNFYRQLLTGDTVDNIPGCPGIGVTFANRILEGCKTVEEYECKVGLAYACSKKVDDPELTMKEQGVLLWMRRQDDEIWGLHANGFRSPSGE